MTNKFKDLLSKAEGGDVASMCQVAYSYYAGEGVKKDTKAAFKHFEKAAKLGSGWANQMCGSMSEVGDGVKQNYSKAKSFYTQGAKIGNLSSAFNLGVLYETGTGVKQSLEKAKTYYELAADGGHVRAARNRAGLAERELPNSDIKSALIYLGKAFEMGDEDAHKDILRLVENLGILPALKKYTKVSS